MGMLFCVPSKGTVNGYVILCTFKRIIIVHGYINFKGVHGVCYLQSGYIVFIVPVVEKVSLWWGGGGGGGGPKKLLFNFVILYAGLAI